MSSFTLLGQWRENGACERRRSHPPRCVRIRQADPTSRLWHIEATGLSKTFYSGQTIWLSDGYFLMFKCSLPNVQDTLFCNLLQWFDVSIWTSRNARHAIAAILSIAVEWFDHNGRLPSLIWYLGFFSNILLVPLVVKALTDDFTKTVTMAGRSLRLSHFAAKTRLDWFRFWTLEV